MNMLSCDSFDNVEVQHLSVGDVVWYYGEYLFLLLELTQPHVHNFGLKFLNLNEGTIVQREHGMHWMLGRVKP